MYFSINSRVLEHLGKDLITSDEIAITELVKNSYDAGANSVKLHLIEDVFQYSFQNHIAPISPQMLSIIKNSLNCGGRIMVLEDNGDGMAYEELEQGFFTIGTDVKKKQKASRELTTERLPLGEKGIGRLAAQRLSKLLFIETTSIHSEVTNVVRVNWEDFIEKSSKLEQIDMLDHELPKMAEKFTRLWFLDLNFQFDSLVDDKRTSQISLFEEEDILEPLTVKESLLSSLSFLLSPFDNDFEDFNIEIYLNEDKVNSKFKNEAIKVAESEHTFFLNNVNGELQLELSMSLSPWYLERIHRTLVGKDLFNDWRKTPVEYKKLLEKYQDKFNKSLCTKMNQLEIQKEFKDIQLHSLQDIEPLEGKVFSFKRDPQLSRMAIDSAKDIGKIERNYSARSIPKFLEANNGIKLYRGKFRIATLGDKDSDWLQLQQARTKGQQFFRFELGNVIGYIKINDPYQDFIKETSSRLNLADNLHSKMLFSFLQNVFYHQFYEFSRSAYYITRDILNDEGMVPTNSLDKLKEKVENVDKKARSSKQHLEEFQSMLTKVQTIIESETDPKIQEAKQVLTSLSATGVVFKETLENTLVQLQEQKSLVKQVEHEKKLIELESYNNYKLMANGLVTEVLTHELHSILSNINNKEHDEAHFRAIEDYLLNFNKYELISDHLDPIRYQTIFLNERVRELSHFYTFMEKTFLYNGNIDDFEEEDVHDFLIRLEQRLENRLKKTAVSIDYSSIDMKWLVPRGVLIHIFYNLIDNSLYWIKERRQKQKHDKSYQKDGVDRIKLEKKDEYSLYYSDTGTGVITRMENTLFQPLQSGKERRGRGMGLYIVRQLLKSFGGDIELLPDRNEYGNRYIFAIYLNAEEKDHGD